MLDVLWMSLDWLPVVLQAPITALLAGLFLMAGIKLVAAFFSILSAILSIIIPWK